MGSTLTFLPASSRQFKSPHFWTALLTVACVSGCVGTGSVQVTGDEASTPAATIGNDFYFASNGSDSGAGTLASPWKTVSKLNQLDLGPGDRVHLRGGDTFSGKISLQTEDSGTASSPVTVGSYGTGRATINPGSDTGIEIRNASGFVIKSLVISGPGSSSTARVSGVRLVNDQAGNTKLGPITLQDLEVKNMGGYGISIVGDNQRSGFKDVTITRVDSHHNGLGGIESYGELWDTPASWAHENIRISYVKAYENPGVPGWSNHSGNGIVLSSVDGAVIERSMAYRNGALNQHVGGPVGIWSWNANDVTIQFNESFENRTASAADGGGFDFDGGTTNSLMQYNYSHDNDGAGFLICSFGGNVPLSGNVVRFNISEDDGRKNGYGAFTFYDVSGSRVQNIDVYNNTVFLSPAATGTPSAIDFMSGTVTSGVRLRNNLFVTTGGIPLLKHRSAQTGLVLQNNGYWTSNAGFVAQYNNVTYTSLTDFINGSGQERYNGTTVGRFSNPLLSSPGGGGTIGNPDLLSNLTAYRLQNGSPMRAAGIDLSIFGIDPGSRNFRGEPIGDPMNIGAD